MVMRKGSEILADELKLNGAEIIYHVPGESFLCALDALGVRYPEIRAISCRHENGAAQMAEAYGKLTGRPGIAFVTRSPGATNAVNAVHTAYQDSSPMILIVGQVKRALMEREAFMAYDFRTMFAPMTKWVAQIDDPRRIPEFVQRAYQTAMTGRMGPVVLVVPEDVFEEECEVAPGKPSVPASAGQPSDEAVEQVFAMLSAAQRPLLIVGGSGWTEGARNDIQAFALANNVPVVTTFRRRDIIDHRLPCYVGEIGIGSNPALLAHVKDTDFVIMCNDALSDVNTIGAGYMEGFTLFDIPVPRQKFVHVTRSFDELNRVFQVDLALLADNDAFARRLAGHAPVEHAARGAWTAALRETFEIETTPRPCPGEIDLPQLMKWLRQRLPEDAIVTNGVGAYATWSQRYFAHYRLHTQLGPISGSMGYSLPAAISAKLLHPKRVVVDFVGDGCYQMSSEELATAVQYGAAVIVVLFNNNMYGTIRIHEENRLEGRVNGTQLVNPDFHALALAYGAHAERVTRTEEFAPAFERCLASGKPALIEMCVDQEAIHSRYSLTDLRNRRKAKH
ncbi:Thiamine pyrophosphate-binding protein [Bosea sp. 62]|uniref:thiamine pyrophosphate-binding protein n=1 Tax=unclassified Bosea (in: a-proteobacteria) TaxID=2653178 RepID=UPI001255293D|nr:MULTISPECIES: thiamine pyrophosphate-binding protein [unclassified Bosea (in: a-proteobacteria)]CAD5256546.1 Thiamine pyrophosphate-binding protein [Bosea sp. 7B]CAD5273926.1 Thiamine pyrophosphate-binding protein [Bosea sp. 21B]CAD5284198.1 Thiamine pyrophosphate-binding protein [Bosea sp. 46]VVT60154.1 Thiamine pyrophosphate-binding protein [Bosea sp. EC-HK365B]VXB57362.1 Thiamine pyrophosphate-binding protein [Bosea sp. 62]